MWSEGGGEPIVGSYSSTNRDRINDIVRADFPTPPSPRIWILITLSSSTISPFAVPSDSVPSLSGVGVKNCFTKEVPGQIAMTKGLM
jgi:hypothetical protein